MGEKFPGVHYYIVCYPTERHLLYDWLIGLIARQERLVLSAMRRPYTCTISTMQLLVIEREPMM